MLISCKCLNFIATSNNQQQQQHRSQEQQHVDAANVGGGSIAAGATADTKENNATLAAVAMQQEHQHHELDCNTSATTTAVATVSPLCSNTNNNGNVGTTAGANNSLVDALKQTFLLKYPRNFVFYSQCIDFFKQAIGPVTDLNINVLNQRDLIYSLTLEVSIEHQPSQTWQLSVCSNCNIALIAKRIGGGGPNLPQVPQSYLINCGILTNNEELSQKRSDKSFSETFGLLIIDHPKLDTSSSTNLQSQLSIGSLSASFATNTSNNLDSKQSRLRQLQTNLQQRLQREIVETEERIQRYTEQQFALLKSFREKSEQEYQMLVKLIQCIPEQQANEWLDRQPPRFDVTNSGGSNLPYGTARRRNTISSRRDLNNTAPTTPTTIMPPTNIFGYSNKEINFKNSFNNAITPTSPTSAIISTNNTRSAAVAEVSSTITEETGTSVPTTTIVAAVVGSGGAVGTASSLRKITHFDTPPATPEATPMSVGNSPTFRPQQQQQSSSFVGQQTFQQQFPTPTIETADDCLFELEGVDAVSSTGHNLSSSFSSLNSSSSIFMQNPPSSPIRQQQLQQQNENLPNHILPGYNNYQRTLTFSNQPPDSHQMSDVEESDGAEEAEDALDLDISTTSMPMNATPQRRININTASNMANYAKSLPIEIANSPLTTTGRSYMPVESEEDELDNNVDIAASIKALAKSVHGEAVFGDLPRPRLRSQI